LTGGTITSYHLAGNSVNGSKILKYSQGNGYFVRLLSEYAGNIYYPRNDFGMRSVSTYYATLGMGDPLTTLNPSIMFSNLTTKGNYCISGGGSSWTLRGKKNVYSYSVDGVTLWNISNSGVLTPNSDPDKKESIRVKPESDEFIDKLE